MNKQTLLRMTVIAAVITVVLVVGGLWWWALLGMTIEVGQAVFLTACVTSVSAAVAWAAWSNA